MGGFESFSALEFVSTRTDLYGFNNREISNFITSHHSILLNEHPTSIIQHPTFKIKIIYNEKYKIFRISSRFVVAWSM
ncbi:hypothetical protein CHRYSEO8AT_350087 [Chryseobacterium sp. 8AT]|nr:hypothetical protein CHRYSEO8AT_350087 [Chryseobacterium sp. 8AT]